MRYEVTERESAARPLAGDLSGWRRSKNDLQNGSTRPGLARLSRAAGVTSAARRSGSLTVAHGTSLYVAAVIGPGLLFIPFLAVDLAGPAAIIAWAALLVVSVPLVITFSALGVRFPTAAGVAAYVRAALGHNAAAAIGACFLAEVVIGVAAIALIGSDYITVLSGWPGAEVTPIAVSSMYGAVLAANYGGIRVSAGSQVVLSSFLVGVLFAAIVVIAPPRLGRYWTPFAPHRQACGRRPEPAPTSAFPSCVRASLVTSGRGCPDLARPRRA